jgi:hypothetical protein
MAVKRDVVEAPSQSTKEKASPPTNTAQGPKPSPGRGPRLDGTSSVPDRQLRIRRV